MSLDFRKKAPTITIIGLYLAEILAETVLSEAVIGLKGINKLLVPSMLEVDYGVLNVMVFVIAIMFVFVNLAVDVSFEFLGPRIRY
ncbi:MAG: ABC transporter permease subunit [Candidatus Lokiarchaeota archaeon]|nr:ABC transporter permease subunit [Candidatus Lokiarchaeota archaeon]